MNLRDRLDAIFDSSATNRNSNDKALKIRTLRAQLDRILANKPHVTRLRPQEELSNLEEILHGSEVETQSGPAFVTEYHYPQDFRHGIRKLDALLNAPTKWLPLLLGTPPARPLSLSDAIFLDTETTGLSGGTGTYAFLVGAGFFTAKGFSVYQYFMRDFHEEPALLSLVSRLVGDKSWLVTFNGKAFDMNLLATRFILCRESFPFACIPHWDLLATSRRVFKPRIGSCSLSNIEREVLGFERQGDIPGCEIPAIYHGFVRDGNAKPLAGVFHHNRLDILSMVTLVTLLLQGIHRRKAVPEFTPWEFLTLGRIMEKSDYAAACRLWEHGLDLTDDERIVYLLKREWSCAAKKAGDYGRAVGFWEDMLAYPPVDPFVHEELAKYWEHKVGDYHNAIVLVEEALVFFGHIRKWREPLEYRRDRLVTKIKRGNEIMSA